MTLSPVRFIFTLMGLAALTLPVQSFADTTAQNLPATLADALKIAAQPDPGELVIAINGDWIKLPKDAPPLGDQPGFQDLAPEYGMQVQTFGAVSAICPVNMTLLDSPPAEPDIYANLPSYAAFTLLMSTLNSHQWNELTSDTGLSLSELTTDLQKRCLSSLLSADGTLILRPHYLAKEKWDDADKIDKTSVIGQCSLRIGLATNISLPIKGGSGGWYGGQYVPPADGVHEYEVADRDDYLGGSTNAYGATVKEDVPNILKSSQLDYSSSIFQTQIPLSGIKSVGDMLARISLMTHLEIYADKRLDQSIQFLGNTQAVPASDLLRAIAVCQMATYRQVGPVFILTDDIAGVGSRRLLWYQFDKLAQNLRSGPVQLASQANEKNHVAKDIPWLDPEGQFSDDQAKGDGTNNYKVPNFPAPTDMNTTYAKLTPGQQAMATREMNEWNAQIGVTTGNQPITTDGQIMLSPALNIQLIVPGISDPVELNVNGNSPIDLGLLFEQGPAPPSPNQPPVQVPAEPVLTPQNIALAAELLVKRSDQKAIVSHAKTSAGVDADLAAVKQLGFTQMWLDVMSDGKVYIPGSPLSVVQSSGKGASADMLAEAISKGKALGIKVFAMVDPFYWGSNPPDGLQDVNIFGETSTQEQARWNQRNSYLPAGQQSGDYYVTGSIIPIFPGVAVSETHHEVRSDLIGLARLLGAHAGLSGIILSNTDPPGYDLGANVYQSEQSPDFELGYTSEARVNMIRANHLDPIDLYMPQTSSGIADTNMPNFSDDNGWTSGLTTDGLGEWAKLRRSINLDLLRKIYAASIPTDPISAKSFTVLVKQRRHTQMVGYGEGDQEFLPGWYGSWDSAIGEPPTLHGYEDSDPSKPAQQFDSQDVQAKSQSKIVFSPATYNDLARSARYLDNVHYQQFMQTSTPVTSAIVIDLDGDPFGDDGNGTDPITNLAQLVIKLRSENAIPPISQAAQPTMTH